jgi:seryl-tRNA synthetase
VNKSVTFGDVTEIDGLVTLGPQATKVLAYLDDIFRKWAENSSAIELTLPPMLPISQANRLDVLRNFPHLEMLVTGLSKESLAKAEDAGHDEEKSFVASDDLAESSRILPSSVCYGAYIHFADSAMSSDTVITSLGRCFRNESHVDGLRRMMSFQMREVIFLGSQSFVDACLQEYSELTAEFLAQLGLPFERLAASDPFFKKNDPRALLQKLDAVKHEFRVNDMAIASVNRHNNFFGERCNIKANENGQHIFTGCIGWGFERCLQALLETYGGDYDRICQGLTDVREKIQ